MLTIRKSDDMKQIEMFCIEQLVPTNHLVRKIEKAINLDFIYPLVQHLYSDVGRASIDPVVLIKLNIIQYMFGIRSMRQTIKEVEVNLAYRWYIGYGLNEKIPHFSTFSKNYERRFFDTTLFSDIFEKIISEIVKHDMLETTNVFIDGSHIKANANNYKSKNMEVERSAKFYEEDLKAEISKDREQHGKKPLKEKETKTNPELKNIKQSTTDPECGVFHKGEHKKVFAYAAQVACDVNGFVMDFTLNPGNVHDSVAFPELYETLKSHYTGMRAERLLYLSKQRAVEL
jgi:transposase